MGIPMAVGTGLMKLLYRPPPSHSVLPPRRELVFDTYKDHHLPEVLAAAGGTLAK